MLVLVSLAAASDLAGRLGEQSQDAGHQRDGPDALNVRDRAVADDGRPACCGTTIAWAAVEVSHRTKNPADADRRQGFDL